MYLIRLEVAFVIARRPRERGSAGASVNQLDRPLYLERIEPFIDAPVVKVLTGLRRSGKSRLLDLVAQRLRDRRIPQERIVHINFSLEWASIASAHPPDRHAPVPGA